MCCFSTIIWREEQIGKLVNLSSIKMKYMFFGLSKTNTRWKIFPSEKVAQSWLGRRLNPNRVGPSDQS